MLRLQNCWFFVLVAIQLIGQCVAEFCIGFTHSCDYPQRCCADTCCFPQGYSDYYGGFRWSIWNMWYFWFIVIFILTSCFGGCGYWRRRQLMLGHDSGSRDMFGMFNLYGRWGGSRPSSCHRNTGHASVCLHSANHRGLYSSELSSTGSQIRAEPMPEQYQFPAPPAYNEVVSKPPGAYDDLPPYRSQEDLGMPSTDLSSIPLSGGMTVPPPYSPPGTGAWAPSGPCPPYTENATSTPAPSQNTSGDVQPTMDSTTSASTQDNTASLTGLRVHLPPI